MVIFDHFSQIIGEADENTSAVAKPMQNIRALADEIGCCVGIIAHSIKGAKRYGISDAESLRGHGSIPANLDLSILVSRQAEASEAISIKPVQFRGAPFNEFGAQFSYEQKDDGSGELWQAIFFSTNVVSKEEQAAEGILAIVELNPGINQTSLRSAAAEELSGIGDQTIRQAIANLERDGRLLTTKGDKNSKNYYIPRSGDGN